MSALDLVADAFGVVGEIIADLESASQIDKWVECERKWGWRYIAKLREEQGAAAALGTECDETQLQPYLRDDRPIDYTRRSGYIVQPGLGFLPKPKAPGIELQKHFVIPGGQQNVYSGLSDVPVGHTMPLFGIQGFVDLWCPDGSVMPDVSYDPTQLRYGRHDSRGWHPPVVVDFKTTGNWKYQKHAKELSTDTQAQLYARWALRETGAHVVDLIWIYFATKEPFKSRRSHLRVTRDHVNQQFERIDDIAKKIHRHKRLQTHPLQLEPNPLSCEMYGGCPYRSKCNLSPSQKTDATAAQYARMKGHDMSNAPTSTAELLARLKAGEPVTPAAAAVMSAPPTVEEHVAANPRAAFLLGGQPALGVNPPEKELPPAPPVGTVAAPPPAAEPEKKKGPGRPRKADKDPTGADAALHTQVKSVEVSDMMGSMLESFSVSWAKEKFSPVAYNDFDIGPFEATGYVQAGETLSQAMARVYGALEAFAEEARARKAVSYKKTLDAMGASR